MCAQKKQIGSSGAHCQDQRVHCQAQAQAVGSIVKLGKVVGISRCSSSSVVHCQAWKSLPLKAHQKKHSIQDCCERVNQNYKGKGRQVMTRTISLR